MKVDQLMCRNVHFVVVGRLLLADAARVMWRVIAGACPSSTTTSASSV